MVAASAQEVLSSPRFSTAFSRVVFAIPSAGKVSQANLAAFRLALSGER